MILTEDEHAADIPTNREFFRDCGGLAAGHHYFIYPKSYAVPHPLLDPTTRSRGLLNSFYEPLNQMCYSFFTVGHADPQRLMSNKVDDSLPIPPEAKHGGHGPNGVYGQAAQTGSHTADN